MDFAQLLVPYSENGRTVEGQMEWLRRKGFSEDIIQSAMTQVYLELAQGEKFENGHALDRHLFGVANELSKEIVKESISIMEKALKQKIDKALWEKEEKKPWYKRLKG